MTARRLHAATASPATESVDRCRRRLAGDAKQLLEAVVAAGLAATEVAAARMHATKARLTALADGCSAAPP